MSKKEPKELISVITSVPTRVCGAMLTYHCPECKTRIDYANCVECPNCGQTLMPMSDLNISFEEENK